MAAFVALCEGFLGINPHFDLWRYFFVVTLQKKREKSSRQELHMPMGASTSSSRTIRLVNTHPCSS